MAGVDKDSIVFDNTCGTGGFLISAMRRMVENAKNDASKIRHIHKYQLVGIEYQDDIYSLAVTNMVLHDDGKSNIYQGDCMELTQKVAERFHPNIGLLNPPYRTKKSDLEELEFVLSNASALQRGGICVAIVPISCVLAPDGVGLELKARLLKTHTLEAVLSLPSDLFHNSKVGVVTAALVVTANIPHPSGKKTWLGYCRDDGHLKRKNVGRVDVYGRWPSIAAEWISAFQNKETIPGLSVTRELQADDEWCAEAYMETDYSSLSAADFQRELKKYVAFRILGTEALKDATTE